MTSDRTAHSPAITVFGPGCPVGGRRYCEWERHLAVQLRDRLNAEHGAGTHHIVG